MNWDRELNEEADSERGAAGGNGAPGDDDGGVPPPLDGPPHEGPEESPIERASRLPLNDFGNGQRMIVHFGDDLMFVPRVGWFVWDGRVWGEDRDVLRVRKLAHQIPKLIAREAYDLALDPADQALVEAAELAAGDLDALRLKAPRDRTPWENSELRRIEALCRRADMLIDGLRKKQGARLRHAKSAGNSGPINNMLQESGPYVARQVPDLNKDPLVINTESGVLELVEEVDGHDAAWAESPPTRRYVVRTRPHDRADLITKMMPVEFVPDATCPRFMTFLEEIQPEAEMREFLKRWFGYTLTGLTSEQKLVFLHGAGRNGKSTVVDLIARMMGEYATSIPIESLTGTEQRKGADATPDLVRVPGARMVRASEPEEGLRFKEAMVKLLTGGEPIMIRKMREEFIEVEPIFKLTISGNHKPNVRGTDEGIWRRILLVPFAQQIAKEAVDPLLPRKLWDERSGILNWLIAGALDFLNGGLREPDEVKQATAEFRDDSDPVGVFLGDACEVTGESSDFVLVRDLIDAFRFYQREQGQAEWGNRAISLRLNEKAEAYVDPKTSMRFARRKTAAANGFSGIRLVWEFKERFQKSKAGFASDPPPEGDVGEFI